MRPVATVSCVATLKRQPKTLITLPKLRTLVLVAQTGSYTAAAAQLDQTRQNIQKQIKELSATLGEVLFEHDARSGRQIPTAFAQHLLPQASEMVDLWTALSSESSRVCTVAFLPQHSYLVGDVLQSRPVNSEGEPILLESMILGEEHRNRESFVEHVLGPLAHGVLDLVVGLPPATDWKNSAKLKQELLYTSRLEAMVPITRERDHIEISELVRQPLLLPPSPTRTRHTLTTAIEQDFKGNAPKLKIEHTAYGTKVLVALGVHEQGTVVVPSDIAHPFKKGSYFGGKGSENFKWVPVCRTGTHDAWLTQKVFANTRAEATSQSIEPVIEALKLAVKREQLDVTATYPTPAPISDPIDKILDALRAAQQTHSSDLHAGLDEAARIVEQFRKAA